MEPIELYKSAHFKEDLTSAPSTLVEATRTGCERDGAMLEHVVFSLIRQKKRAEVSSISI